MTRLFDDRPYMDSDYLAAVEFVCELFPDAPDELLPGFSSAEFCPVARTLAVACGGTDFPEELTTEEMERIGGLSTLFTVGSTSREVQFPALGDWAIYPDIDGAEKAEEAEDSGLYTWDANGGDYLRRTEDLPIEVCCFIQRFDAGEFPSLHLEESAR